MKSLWSCAYASVHFEEKLLTSTWAKQETGHPGKTRREQQPIRPRDRHTATTPTITAQHIHFGILCGSGMACLPSQPTPPPTNPPTPTPLSHWPNASTCPTLFCPSLLSLSSPNSQDFVWGYFQFHPFVFFCNLPSLFSVQLLQHLFTWFSLFYSFGPHLSPCKLTCISTSETAHSPTKFPSPQDFSLIPHPQSVPINFRSLPALCLHTWACASVSWFSALLGQVPLSPELLESTKPQPGSPLLHSPFTVGTQARPYLTFTLHCWSRGYLPYY